MVSGAIAQGQTPVPRVFIFIPQIREGIINSLGSCHASQRHTSWDVLQPAAVTTRRSIRKAALAMVCWVQTVRLAHPRRIVLPLCNLIEYRLKIIMTVPPVG